MTEEKPIEAPKLDEKDVKIKELNDILLSLSFFSDQVRFNQIVHKGISIILDKLGVLESNLKELAISMQKVEVSKDGASL